MQRRGGGDAEGALERPAFPVSANALLAFVVGLDPIVAIRCSGVAARGGGVLPWGRPSRPLHTPRRRTAAGRGVVLPQKGQQV